jgi:hypothetical protein
MKSVKILTTFLFVSVFAAAAMLSCENPTQRHEHPNNSPNIVLLRSYVMGYFEPAGIELAPYPHPNPYPADCHIISIEMIRGEAYACFRDEDKSEYDRLSEKHNDTGFNREYHIPIDGGIVEFPCVDFTAVDVVCLQDFDAAHPAGTSMIELADICFNTPAQFIAGGYDTTGYEVHEQLVYSFIKKPLADVTPADLVLLGTGNIDDCDPHGHYRDHIGFIIFPATVMPDTPGTYTFKVTFSPDDGSDPFEATVDMNFEPQQ